MDSPSAPADTLDPRHGAAARGSERTAATSERPAEHAAADNEDASALLEVILDRTSAGFALLDADGRILRINPAMASFLAIANMDPVGRTLRDMLPREANALEAIATRVIRRGVPELRIAVSGAAESAVGQERHWVASVVPMRQGGSAARVAVVIDDITERKALEGQLLHAQKMEAVGRLAGGIAHDFNNMLTAVMSYSDLLLQDLAEGDARRDDVVEIASAARRAAGLTRQLLAFSRQQVLQVWPVDLNATVREIEAMLGRLIGADVQVVTTLEPRLGIVRADPGQIGQILMNLAVNARDAMPTGGRLTIETANVTLDEGDARVHCEIAAGDYVMLSVSDTGAGMTSETQARIFEPFFTTKEQGRGTGLGLSTVYGIVKQAGGGILVESEPGRGTTFRIFLPRVDAPASVAVPLEQTAATHQGTEVILLVEDDPTVRTVVARILRASGYEVLEASNGTQALRICENPDRVVDLLISDIVMPEMGGREFARLFGEMRPAARMLFMSGYAEDAVTDGAMASPGAAFIEKPFTMEGLAKKVREVLESPASAPPPR